MNHLNLCLSWLYSLFFRKTSKSYLQFFRYIVLGSISNILDFSCLYLLTEFMGFHYTISASVSFIVGVLSNHAINVIWIFDKRKYDIYLEIMLVIIISFVGLCLCIAIIYVLVEYANIYYMISKVISAIITMFWNFYSRKKWIFKQ